MKLKELKKICLGLNVEIDIYDAGHSIDLDAWAPPGMRFKASDCHSLVVQEFNMDEKGQAERLYGEMATQIQAGLKKCEDEDCDCAVDSPDQPVVGEKS